MLNKLRDPRFVLLLVGLAQIVELYCEVSLEGQEATHLPTQVWKSVVLNKQELELLSEHWLWGHKDLKYTSLEPPEKIVERITESGVYRAHVQYKNIMRKGRELKEAGLLEDGETVADLFEDGEMKKALAGEIPLEIPVSVGSTETRRPQRSHFCDGRALPAGRPMTEVDLEEVEEKLKSLCSSIMKEWNSRMKQSPLMEAAYNALSVHLNTNDGERRVAEMESLLDKILTKLPDHTRERYDRSLLLGGYASFMSLYKELESCTQYQKIYEKWYKDNVAVEDPKESNIHFSDFFECLQVRSSSEAFCETVGSVMNNHIGKGRHLRPVNFNTEICLEVNLGPTYLSEDLVKEVFALHKKSYLYSTDSSNNIVSRYQLKAPGIGSALNTYRKRQEYKSRLPVDFWKWSK